MPKNVNHPCVGWKGRNRLRSDLNQWRRPQKGQAYSKLLLEAQDQQQKYFNPKHITVKLREGVHVFCKITQMKEIDHFVKASQIRHMYFKMFLVKGSNQWSKNELLQNISHVYNMFIYHNYKGIHTMHCMYYNSILAQ